MLTETRRPPRGPTGDRAFDDITDVLNRWQSGDLEALDPMMPNLLREFRRLARSVLGAGYPNRTLGVTALVHEGYLRLARQSGVRWSCRRELFAYMATTMRRIVINHARDRRATKRGGDAIVLPLELLPNDPAEPGASAITTSRAQLLDLDDALDDLARLDERQAKLVELRYFLGLSTEETAEVLGVSERTVKRDWHSARLWLRHRLGD